MHICSTELTACHSSLPTILRCLPDLWKTCASQNYNCSILSTSLQKYSISNCTFNNEIV